VADNQLLVVGSTLQLGGHASYDSFGVYFNDERNVVRLERSTIDISTGQTTYGVRLTDLNNLLVMVQNHVISGAGVTSLGVHSYGGTGILVGNVLEDRGASIYYGVELTGPTESSSGHFEVLNNVIHADEADLAVGLRTSNSELAAMNNVVWIQNGSAVEIAATSALELYHNALSAPPGRCLLETGSVGGFCALDIDDVNACAADGWCAGVGGNLAAAPAFVDPASDDYHLLATSALIDRGYDPIAGDGLAGLDRATGPLGAMSLFTAGLAAVDGDGDQRPLGARWDIGIDEQ
jgi:hypothetical protein